MIEINKGILEELLKNKTTFIFDMDGTIVDLEELNYSGYREAIKEHFKLELSKEEFFRYFAGTRTSKGFSSYLESVEISEYDVEELTNAFRNIKRDSLLNNIENVITLKKGIVEFFNELKESGKKICLATSTVKEFTYIILKHFDFEKYFDEILTAADVTEGKPSPQIYNIALERLKSTKDESVIFEDSKSGIESAINSGVMCVGIYTKGFNDEYVINTDKIIEDYQLN